MPELRETKPKAKTRMSVRERQSAMKPIERITMDMKDAAAYLGISTQIAYAEAKEGRLPIVRIRGRVLVVKPLLDEMIMEQARRDWKPEPEA
jgi:hypothetical protein